MSVDPVVVDDDDVVMILNDDNQLCLPKKPSYINLGTIDLDEEPLSAAPSNELAVTDSDKDSSFARLLKNNTLMNKIVHHCLNMTNNAGMSRVIHKTLEPLYADADSKFKESEQFTELLKTSLKKLKHDPDHKFLHVKSLCEELKAGKYRRKVHFVTLCTDLKEERRKRALEKQYEKQRRHQLRKRRRKDRSLKKTDVVALDNSDDEPIITLSGDDVVISDNDADESDTSDEVMIVDETATSDVGSEQSNKENRLENIQQNGNEITTPSNEGQMLRKTSNEELLDVACSQSDNPDPVIGNTSPSIQITSDDENVDQTIANITASSPVCHTESEPEITSNNEHISNKNNNKSPNTDLLIPKKAVKVDQHSRDYCKIMEIERLIALYQEKIVELEQQEVTNNYNTSPYLLCDKYKAKIVQLYKKLCRLTGNGDGDLRKHKVVRLQVMEGHPPGPVQKLERMLNNSVDETGALLFPDFHDVVECVTQSNITDKLGWNKQEIMKEAIMLFTQCGHALRKKRQRREYKDLLNLVKDKSIDEYDPANEDPNLFAKLEENKLIAKANEDEVLERFTRMEYLPKTSKTLTPRLGNMTIIRDAEDTDSESKSEQDKTEFNQNRMNITSANTTRISQPDDVNRNLVTNVKCSVTNIIHNVIRNAFATDREHIPPTEPQVNTTDETPPDDTNTPTETPDTTSNTPTRNLISIRTEGNYIVINEKNMKTHNLTNYSLAYLQSIAKPNSTVENVNDEIRVSMSTPNITATTIIDDTSEENNVVWPNSLQKMGNSNRYVLSFESEDEIKEKTASNNQEPENSVNKTPIKEEKPDSDLIVSRKESDTIEDENNKVKNEVKEEPIDINELLNALGDNYISTIFDIEDPFLVVEISSDSSDDDL